MRKLVLLLKGNLETIEVIEYMRNSKNGEYVVIKQLKERNSSLL